MNWHFSVMNILKLVFFNINLSYCLVFLGRIKSLIFLDQCIPDRKMIVRKIFSHVRSIISKITTRFWETFRWNYWYTYFYILSNRHRRHFSRLFFPVKHSSIHSVLPMSTTIKAIVNNMLFWFAEFRGVASGGRVGRNALPAFGNFVWNDPLLLKIFFFFWTTNKKKRCFFLEYVTI
jgi:hypothetical protein